MPNDTSGSEQDFVACIFLKLNIDTWIINPAVKFFQHLIFLSKNNDSITPIVVFAHSMGAIIVEHALKLLKPTERRQIRIYTLGGGSFITPDNCHPDSHNFASANDLVCLLGSPFLRTLAMRRHCGLKEGCTEDQLILRWAQEDAMLYADSSDTQFIEKYEKQRQMHYKTQLLKINNTTIIDPQSTAEHSFNNDCYQNIVKNIVSKYRRPILQQA